MNKAKAALVSAGAVGGGFLEYWAMFVRNPPLVQVDGVTSLFFCFGLAVIVGAAVGWVVNFLIEFELS